MVRPITRMRTVALTMAGGDLTARAEDGSNDEYGELGRALNYLSSELGSTISSLQMERNRLQSLINGLSEGIIAVDAKGATTLINPAVYGLLNLQSTDDNVRAAAPDVFAMFDQALSSAQAVKKTVWQGDVALHISVSPLLLQSGEVTGCVGIVSDVTRRDYVANVSHELRTPLTAMRALIEPLRDGLVKTEEQRQQIYDVVLRETMRLSRLVNDMLELSRLQSGTASLSRSVFAPLPLFNLIHETYSAYAEDYQQTFVYDVPEDLPSVWGNPDRTQQVLIVLLDNAFKYTPEGGVVTLSACAEGDVVRVRVRDTGVGIPAADLPHVFDRFYKVDKSHHSKGTGLGLALADQIIRTHRGRIRAESTIGRGTTFYVYLPVLEQQQEREQLQWGVDSKLRILAADDNNKVLDLLDKDLSALGLSVSTCSRRGELRQLLEQQPFDVLAIDESLMSSSGVDFCMAIRGRYPGMTRIVMTNAPTREIVDARSHGVIDGYVVKPVSASTLLAQIRSSRKE